MMLLISIGLVFLLILQDVILFLLLRYNFKNYGEGEQIAFPQISILIPCRNEAHNLPQCLEALESLDYPSSKLQIIMGNDGSEDGTAQILQQWAKQNSQALYLEVKAGDGFKMNGKANALQQMVGHATGELLLFTDADCVVGPNWARSMVAAWQSSQAGVVTGITRIKGHALFDRMQAFDWWLTLGMVKVMDDLGIAVTSMGNNMLISKSAYDAVGGFEGIPFSLTEDFEMAKQIEAKGFPLIHLVNQDNLVVTKGQDNFAGLMRQRKRWMSGAMDLPSVWKLLLGLQVLFFPAVLFLVFLYPFEGIILWLIKVLIQGLFIYCFALKTRIRLKWVDFLLFEIYYMLTAWSTIVYYFWPSKTDWKGRKY
ncbi:glycosyltransferase [Cecembia lonarensis]|uniref:Poly-beta-1,6-N-acetyl-D-glucosamine synthase n=1 Tax=Cecembia lonarensis (strain CCUG 58316 / KCTC 22772 / LW9) TaxID=1225176 RepID=K1LFB1_CECL9|nr:glycosyltransferase [Cecembia lonarensis]EKB49023.1 Poly-beta-1,6-N-acetyl-D-glucosamine synthase [Cecembia lonarensis LW9]